MSSFVIDKRSYVRVGAIVAGVCKARRGSHCELWVYDYEKNRPMKGLDFVDRFVECYKLNVESVCKQYAHDKEYGNPNTYIDNDDYDDDYVRYFKYGEKIAFDTLLMMDTVWDIINFSNSVSYQIEDPVCNEVVMGWFNMIISKLTRIADLEDERNQWGEFDLGLDKEKALD